MGQTLARRASSSHSFGKKNTWDCTTSIVDVDTKSTEVLSKSNEHQQKKREKVMDITTFSW